MTYRNPALALAASVLLVACQASPVGGPANDVTSQGASLSAVKQIAVGKTPHGMDVAGGFAYNSNIGDNTISVIDGSTDAVVLTIPVPNGGTPGPVKAFPDGKQVIVCDTKNNALMVIDPAQGHKIIQTIQLPQTPSSVAIDDDNTSVLVTASGTATAPGTQAYALTFDATDRAKAPTMKTFTLDPSTAEGRAAGFSGDWAAIPSNGSNDVQLINMGTGDIKTVSDGNQPTPVAIGKSEDAGVVAIVGNFASNTITFYQLPNGDKKTLSDVGLSPDDIMVDNDLHRAYLTMAGSNQVAVVDYLAETLVGKIAVGARPVHIQMAPVLPGAAADAAASPAKRTLLHNGAEEAPLSHELWVGDDAGGGVTVFDGDSMRVKATVSTGNGHHKIAFVGSKAYVSNITDNTVSVVDRTQIK